MTVISNYVDGIKTFGEAEAIVEHYAELSHDPKITLNESKNTTKKTKKTFPGDLPEVFAICSSFLIKHVTTDLYFFQTYKVYYTVLSSSVKLSYQGRVHYIFRGK